MNPESSLINAARAGLNHSQVIDLTTTGRRTGQPRRIEIFLHHDDGQLFITGMPRADRTRDWICNIEADPQVVVHLKQSIVVDVPATARVVTLTLTNAGPSSRRPPADGVARMCRTCSSTARSSCSPSPTPADHPPGLKVLDIAASP